MSEETVLACVQSLGGLANRQGKDFAVVLHGGEPLLLGEERLSLLLGGLRETLPKTCTLSIQTNGVLLTERVMDVCVRTHTTIAVSLDGPREVHDRHRLDFNRRGTFDRAVAAVRLLLAHPESNWLFTGILAVIDPTTNPEIIYRFFKELGVPSMDFLYRDGNHSHLPAGKAAFESREYGRWLARMWDLYLADPSPVPVNILDDVTRLILGGQGSKEGVGPRAYGIVIIETDGTVAKNDTLKSAFDGADRFSSAWSVHRDTLADVVCTDEFNRYSLLQHPTSPVCKQCPYLSVCGGGMPLYRWKYDTGYDNPSVYCNDHKLVIDHIRKRLPVLLKCKPS
jgi:uncharacterized protein